MIMSLGIVTALWSKWGGGRYYVLCSADVLDFFSGDPQYSAPLH
jgi:hypothetical protein